MNTESLCGWKENEMDKNKNGNPYANTILKDWRKTSSPFWNYWGQMMYDVHRDETTDAFKNYILPLGKLISLILQIHILIHSQ